MSVVPDETPASVDASALANGGNIRASTAVVFTAVNTLAAHPVNLPTIGPSDLLLRTHLTGISPMLEGPLLAGAFAHLPGMAYPLTPGQGAVGEVVAMGSAVPAEWHGARVFAATARAPGGITAAWGTQCAHIVAPVDAAVRLGDLSPHAGIFLTQIGMALHGLDRAAMAAGCRALVLGQGPLGQILARLARLRGAGRVTVADTSARHLSFARADQTIHLPSRSSRHDAQGPTVFDDDVDLLIDTTGDADLVAGWLPALRRSGTLLLLSYYSRLELAAIQKPRDSIRIALSSDWTTADLIAAYHLVAEGQIDLAGLISHTFPLSRVGQAYLIALGDPDAMHVVLTWI